MKVSPDDRTHAYLKHLPRRANVPGGLSLNPDRKDKGNGQMTGHETIREHFKGYGNIFKTMMRLMAYLHVAQLALSVSLVLDHRVRDRR